MDDRLSLEMAILRRRYPRARLEGRWALVPDYQLPVGWSATAINTAFNVPDAYPGAGLYGIYVPSGLLFNGQSPSNFADPAATQPPFEGKWAIFSWQAEQWFPKATPEAGHSFLTWVDGFAKRFREGN